MGEFFPREQILVVISERFRKDALRELRSVRNFIGLSDRSSKDVHEELRERHVCWQYLETLSDEDRAVLRDLYASDVLALKQLLGDPLPEWHDFAPINTPFATLSITTAA